MIQQSTVPKVKLNINEHDGYTHSHGHHTWTQARESAVRVGPMQTQPSHVPFRGLDKQALAAEMRGLFEPNTCTANAIHRNNSPNHHSHHLGQQTIALSYLAWANESPLAIFALDPLMWPATSGEGALIVSFFHPRSQLECQSTPVDVGTRGEDTIR